MKLGNESRKMITADDKIKTILELLKSGKIVYISTPLKSYKITQKDVDKFDKTGKPLLKASEGSMFLAVGKRYVCINYCKFTVEG